MVINSKKLYELRKEKGVKQSDAASGAGVSIKTIYRHEHSKVKRYEPKTIEKLADYYGVSISDILKNENVE